MKKREYDSLIQVHKRLISVIDYSYVYLRNGLHLMQELENIKKSIEEILMKGKPTKRRKKNG